MVSIQLPIKGVFIQIVSEKNTENSRFNPTPYQGSIYTRDAVSDWEYRSFNPTPYQGSIYTKEAYPLRADGRIVSIQLP